MVREATEGEAKGVHDECVMNVVYWCFLFVCLCAVWSSQMRASVVSATTDARCGFSWPKQASLRGLRVRV
jgi:hypothetical protein